MKTLRLLFASITFCFLFMCQSNAQVITNNTPCWFKVKSNIIPVGACIPSGFGPVGGVPGFTVINVPTLATEWVVSYGIKRPGVPGKMPGEPLCGFTQTLNLGTCAMNPVFGTYLGENLTIHF